MALESIPNVENLRHDALTKYHRRGDSFIKWLFWGVIPGFFRRFFQDAFYC